jgi:hypothetical protein
MVSHLHRPAHVGTVGGREGGTQGRGARRALKRHGTAGGRAWGVVGGGGVGRPRTSALGRKRAPAPTGGPTRAAAAPRAPPSQPAPTRAHERRRRRRRRRRLTCGGPAPPGRALALCGGAGAGAGRAAGRTSAACSFSMPSTEHASLRTSLDPACPRGPGDKACPFSTGGGTRRVRLVRGEGRDVSSQYGREGEGAGRDAGGSGSEARFWNR